MEVVISEVNPHIIAVTELKPKRLKSIELAEFSIPGYTLFLNKDPVLGAGLYMKNSLNAAECVELNDNNFHESVWCSFTGNDDETVLIGCIYKSPNSNDQNVENLHKLLIKAGSMKFDKICIVGDFNYPTVKWNGEWTSTKDEIFVDCIRDAFLHQMTLKPTRRREGQRPTLDDLVLVNDETLVSDIVHCSPLGKSDHDILLFKMYVNEKRREEMEEERYDLSKGDYESMKKDIEMFDWSGLESLQVEECWKVISKCIKDSMSKNIPKVKSTQTGNKKPRWMNTRVRKSVKKKLKTYKKYIKTKSSHAYGKYIESRNECSRVIKKAKREYERKLAKDCKLNPKLFWKYVQNKTKVTTGISPLTQSDGGVAVSDKDKADVLNSFFSSVFTQENMHNIPHLEEGSRSENTFLMDILITPQAVAEKLKELDINKAQGPDKIPPRVLKELSQQLSVPLSILFNKSIELGILPLEWKQAEVVGIFKKGTRSDPGNYRPVSLTCVLCKVLECFIRDAIVRHMTDFKLYASCQHGFRNKRSCVTQLLEVMEILTDCADEGEAIDMIYLDFKKAFDSVPHQRLLVKLKSYGITGKVYSWVADFLSDRCQRVRVGRDRSSYANVLSGIPQGSILGPVLFTIFINDISDNIQSFCRIFADDTKIFDKTKNSNILQDDLYRLQEWSETWNLYFNASKCNVLHMGKHNPSCTYVLETGGQIVNINECKQEKDLGVIFDSKLSFDAHVQSCISKANRILGIIRRSFSYLNKESFLLLYKSLVRPHLEYANVIWAPKFKRQSAAIERVQRRATRLLPEVRELTYESRMRYLNLPSLKYRRFRGDLLQTFKIMNKIDDLNTSDFYSFSSECRTRCANEKVFINRCCTNTKLHCFSHRTARQWNNISSNTRNAKNINEFKNLLDKDPKRLIFSFDFDK